MSDATTKLNAKQLMSSGEYQRSFLSSYSNDFYMTITKQNHEWRFNYGLARLKSGELMELSEWGVACVNVESHQLLLLNEEDMNCIEPKQLVDLDDEGARWEGDALQSRPCGWGVLYDGDNNKLYEGFRIGDVNVCYGTKYYSDIQKVEYKGEICEGMRWGRGVQYDRNGNTVFDGEWLNDDHLDRNVVIDEECQLLHNHIESLTVRDSCCNEDEWTALDFSLLPKIRELRVGDECFANVEELKLVGLKELETVVIGMKSFTLFKNGDFEDPNRHFYLKDCERLKELRIGCHSFSDYSVCELSALPALETIAMGSINEDSSCFFYASLELRSGDFYVTS